jgi:hypothetical protein
MQVLMFSSLNGELFLDQWPMAEAMGKGMGMGGKTL